MRERRAGMSLIRITNRRGLYASQDVLRHRQEPGARRAQAPGPAGPIH